jgi:glutathione S-transferase
MLEEIGVKYENVPVHFIREAHSAEHLRINPNGRVPALDDDGLVMFESLAINLHLARKYGASLWPAAPDDQSRAIQWTLWAATELEPAVIRLLMNRLFMPPASRNEAEAIDALRALDKSIVVLDGALRDRAFLLGDSFSVADLNVFSVLEWRHPALRTPYLDSLDETALSATGSLNLDPAPNAARWARLCGERPSLARVLAMRRKRDVPL